jgi:transposase-like protein
VAQVQAAVAGNVDMNSAAAAMGVPRHTLSGWVRRYRAMGHEITVGVNVK